ncbi:hypothetical protein C6C12_19180, partial [Clostridium botulinum]|uniref:hypothetical protein n=1 Tax=Clostridium botulinum TaxID=1491 RepID=UPI000D0D2127
MGKVINLTDRCGGDKVRAGVLLKERMECLNVSVNKLSDLSLVEEDIITNIIEQNLSVEDIDEMDLDFISQALYCTPEYFYDSKIREKDVINHCLNRGENNVRANLVKVKLQQFANDFEFLMTIK